MLSLLSAMDALDSLYEPNAAFSQFLRGMLIRCFFLSVPCLLLFSLFFDAFMFLLRFHFHFFLYFLVVFQLT